MLRRKWSSFAESLTFESSVIIKCYQVAGENSDNRQSQRKRLNMCRNKIFIYCSIFGLCSCHYGTGIGDKIHTPKEFLSNVHAEKSLYLNDSIQLVQEFSNLMVHHEQSFGSKEYFSKTRIIIDTILYSANYYKLAVFIITENPTSRQLSPKENYKVYYNAFCYLAMRDSIGGALQTRWLRSFYPINWYSQAEVSSLLRDMYFTEFATIKNGDKTYTYKYNLDDIRFWDCPVWEVYFGHRKK